MALPLGGLRFLASRKQLLLVSGSFRAFIVAQTPIAHNLSILRFHRFLLAATIFTNTFPITVKLTSIHAIPTIRGNPFGKHEPQSRKLQFDVFSRRSNPYRHYVNSSLR